MQELRMERTAGLAREADVWLGGTLLTVCDGVSTAARKTRPGPIEQVAFRIHRDEGMDWADAVAANPSHRMILESENSWRYIGFGRIEQVMPVRIDFGILTLEDPTWSTDENLVGTYVAVSIDRLELIPEADADWPEEMK